MATESEQLDGDRFDAFVARYDEDTVALRRAARDEVVRRAVSKPGNAIVDIGCGTGTALLACAGHFTHALGLDVSHNMLRAANAKASEAQQINVGTMHAGFSDLDAPDVVEKIGDAVGPVSVVMSNYAMHHLDRPEKILALRAMASLLEPGGTLLLGDLMEFDAGAIAAGEDPDHVGFDPEWDKPEPVAVLADALEQCHMTVRSHRMHALVGVLEGIN